MLKAVIDTNVFISGLLKDSTNRKIISALKNNRFKLIISPATLKELIDVLSRPKFHPVITRDIAARLIETIHIQAVAVRPRRTLTVIKEDPQDNRFLEAAMEGADLIVSGDSHLLALKKFRHIPILTPREFLSRLKKA